MNILLINHYAGSRTHGMEYRPYYFAREWVRAGHQVTVVAASFSHLRTVAPTTTEPVTEEWIEGVRYLWYRTPSYHGNGVARARNIFSFVRQLWFDARRLAREYRPDLVIASSTYPLDIVPAHRIARAASAKLVYEVHDLWPLTPIELGQMSARHPFILLMQWAENYAYRHADRVVSLLPKAAEHMCAHGMDPRKFCYIPNGVSMDEWTPDDIPLPSEHQETLTRLKQEGRFILGYAGGHALSNALDSLIEAAQRIEAIPVSIVLVGHGVEKDRLMRKSREMGLRNIIFLPPVPKALIPRLLQECDACYLGWARSPLYRFGVCPNKLLDYMMAGKPVIHAIDAGNDLVAEAGCGISIPPESPQAIADAIAELSSKNPAELAAMGGRGREYVACHHQYAGLARELLEATA
jgi:glycosyltransferase involved in cell wall biosynthesis